MFIVVKKKNLILCFVALFCAVALVCTGVALSQKRVFSVKSGTSVVIDAGHGGADPGVVGKNGLVEAELNLAVSLSLRDRLQKENFNVTMTRSTAEGLYGEEGKNFKARDFAARKKIIRDTDPDLVVSIHANKFPQSAARRGIQVFFNPSSREGKRFAEVLQSSLNRLNEKYVGKTFSALAGEYFMLNCTTKPSVIVECGFLSNPEDERLLSDEKYREELTEAICSGILDYLRI